MKSVGEAIAEVYELGYVSEKSLFFICSLFVFLLTAGIIMRIYQGKEGMLAFSGNGETSPTTYQLREQTDTL